MRSLFKLKIKPFLYKDNNQEKRNLTLFFKIYGYTESYVNHFIIKLTQKSPISWGILSKEDGIFIKFYLSPFLSKNELKEKKLYLIKKFKNHFKNSLYSFNNLSILHVVRKLILRKNLTISTIESCTGGLLGFFLNKIQNSSKYYLGSIIPYNTKVKLNILKVPYSIIRNSSINSESVISLAKSGLEMFQSDICISISGNLGPNRESPFDPKIGVIYFCLSYKNKHIVKKENFVGSRQILRKKATFFALNMLRLFLKKER